MAKTHRPEPTRFRIFVLPRYSESPLAAQPETITVSTPTNKITKGPADERMYVRDAQFKKPYADNDGPPYRGQANPPVLPGPDGHFDRIDVHSREFLCATMYATVRRTLDIWESYFGRTIPWFFRLDLKRLELIPLVEWDNAQSGYGFLEFGYARGPGGKPDKTRPYCENFDVLAHELGHNILFSEVGVPSSPKFETEEYGGFQESGADLVAIVATLHFHTIVDHLLATSKGNLFTENELSRIGEVGKSSQIRLALNAEKMSTVSREPHDLSLPLTGAIFDIFVEMYQKELVQAGLISQSLADRSFGPEGGEVDHDAMEAEFAAAYTGHEAGFKKCLEKSRDDFGRLLATTWQHLSADHLHYTDVAKALFDADTKLFAGRHADTIRVCFRWREITLSGNARERTRFMIEECRNAVAPASQAGSGLLASPPSLGAVPPLRAASVSDRKSQLSASADSGEPTELEYAVYQVCAGDGVAEGQNRRALVWIDPQTTFDSFRSGKVSQLLFHRENSAPGQIETWAETFTDRLLIALKFWRYTADPDASAAIRAVATQPDSPMQDLLDAVSSHVA